MRSVLVVLLALLLFAPTATAEVAFGPEMPLTQLRYGRTFSACCDLQLAANSGHFLAAWPQGYSRVTREGAPLDVPMKRQATVDALATAFIGADSEFVRALLEPDGIAFSHVGRESRDDGAVFVPTNVGMFRPTWMALEETGSLIVVAFNRYVDSSEQWFTEIRVLSKGLQMVDAFSVPGYSTQLAVNGDDLALIRPGAVTVVREFTSPGRSIHIVSPPFQAEDAAPVEGGFLLAGFTGTEVVVARLELAGLSPAIPIASLSGDAIYTRVRIAATSAGAIVLWGRHDDLSAARISQAGNVLDRADFPDAMAWVSRTAPQPQFDVIARDGRYFVAWTTGFVMPGYAFRDVRGAVLSESDPVGTLQDTARFLSSDAARQWHPNLLPFQGGALAVWGEDVTVASPYQYQQIHAALLDSAGVIVREITLTEPYLDPHQPILAASSGAEALVVWTEPLSGSLRGRRLLADGTVRPEFVVAPRGLLLALECDTSGHCVAIIGDDRVAPEGSVEIYAILVSGDASVAENLVAVPAEARTPLAIESDGTQMMLVWTEWRESHSMTRRARVELSERSLSVDVADLFSSPSAPSFVKLTWDGTRYLIVEITEREEASELRSMFIDRRGEPLSGPLPAASLPGRYWLEGVVWDGRRFITFLTDLPEERSLHYLPIGASGAAITDAPRPLTEGNYAGAVVLPDGRTFVAYSSPHSYGSHAWRVKGRISVESSRLRPSRLPR